MNAGTQGIAKCYFHIQVVQFFQKTVLFFIEQVGQELAVIVLHQFLRSFHQYIAQIARTVNPVGFPQPFHNRPLVFIRQLPEPWIFAAPYRMGVRYIMHIVQIRLTAISFSDQGNRGTARIDPTAHFVIPGGHIRTGRSIRLLCIDKKLIVKIIGFVKARCRG